MGQITYKDFDVQSVMPRSHQYMMSGDIRVAFYGRVSTEHEEQMSAFENQIQWYNDLLKRNPNWILIKQYSDKGVTGTNAVKRHGFMDMIEDAKNGEFDIIVTREVCRFARNTVDTLEYSRRLMTYGVEVFFVEDNIWSWAQDGELRLTIMAAMAQEESRKCSERVRAGQYIARQNGILFGSGNILGYDLVRGETSKDNTYVINEEQAKAVKRIYELYLKGYGMKKITTTLCEEHYVDARGRVKWTVSVVARVLKNKTYAGYIGYQKSHTVSYLEHKRKNNRDIDSYEYRKGNFPAIISEEDWEEVQKIRKSRCQEHEGQFNRGKRTTKDAYWRKLRCSCGKSYKKYKWRVKKGGKISYGYSCCNQVANRGKAFREKNGLDTEGYCNVKSVAKWRLEMMMMTIVQYLWKNPKETADRLIAYIEKLYIPEEENDNTEKQIDILNARRKELNQMITESMRMMVKGEISREEHIEMVKNFKSEVDSVEEQLEQLDGADKDKKDSPDEIKAKMIQSIRSTLDDLVMPDHYSCEDMVDSFVDRIVPFEGRLFRWYLNLTKDEAEEEDYLFVCRYKIGFESAKAYQREHGCILRSDQWEDMTVELFLKA